jgi:hypothetical protein
MSITTDFPLKYWNIKENDVQIFRQNCLENLCTSQNGLRSLGIPIDFCSLLSIAL